MNNRIDIRIFLKDLTHKVLICQISLVEYSVWMDCRTVTCHQVIHDNDFFLARFNQTVHHVRTDVTSPT